MNRRLTPPRWGPSDIERQASGAHPAPLRDRLHRGSKRGPSPLPSLMSTRSPSPGARPGAPGCRSDPLLSPPSRAAPASPLRPGYFTQRARPGGTLPAVTSSARFPRRKTQTARGRRRHPDCPPPINDVCSSMHTGNAPGTQSGLHVKNTSGSYHTHCPAFRFFFT